MQASIASTDTDASPVNGPAPEDGIGGSARRPDPHEEDLYALRRSLQEQRRVTTLLNAEVQKQTEAREAMEAQLIEANAEIAASWDRRKEMTRVITDRDAKLAEAKSQIQAKIEVIADREAKLADAKSEIDALRERQEEMANVIVNRDAMLAEARGESKANRERRKEIAQVVANRDAKILALNAQIREISQAVSNRNAKISQLKADLQARYEELATLQRHIARSSLSGRAKRLVSPVTRLFRNAL